MARTNDIVFIFSGGTPFSSQFDVSVDFNLQMWRTAEAKLTYDRKLFAESRGVDKNVENNMFEVMATIKGFAAVSTLGQVCLLGRSAGCLLALAVAAELQNQGLRELTFVGLSDVPMYHDGNNPPVPNVGAIKPKNSPIASGAKAPDGTFAKVGVEPVTEIPQASLDQEINVKAGNKIQLYQTQGNHMKYARSRSDWVWMSDSTMEGEVHGLLDGWENIPHIIAASRLFGHDLDFHVGLNTGAPWKNMALRASQAFANLPSSPQP